MCAVRSQEARDRMDLRAGLGRERGADGHGGVWWRRKGCW